MVSSQFRVVGFQPTYLIFAAPLSMLEQLMSVIQKRGNNTHEHL
jgi:hypothetical protein